MALLAIDELVDAGRILEIDPPAIANRVLMRGADAQQPQTAELGFQQVRARTFFVPCGRALVMYI